MDTDTQDPQVQLSDSQLAVEMLRRKLVNEVQLKAAIDYQESVGGRLLDILGKLGLVSRQALEDFLRKLEDGGEAEATGIQETEPPPDPAKLKIHRKLLEKVPGDLAQNHGVLLFFPPPGTRAILMSTDPPAPGQLIDKLRALLGVEIKPIDLGADDRKRFVDSSCKEVKKAGSTRNLARTATPPVAEEPEASQVQPGGSERRQPVPAARDHNDEQQVLKALINLLIRKNLLTADELRVEMELIKRRKR